ncbi:DUF680 domain-containing protein [Mesorhizobium sp. WSM3860]|nr:DUF680 domain-containing protein [Mesorhizobium sp. WSM3860]
MTVAIDRTVTTSIASKPQTQGADRNLFGNH